jgi:hypothetical protein
MMKLFLIICFTVLGLNVRSQISISGPTCAAPGVTYQYLISGAVDTGTTITVCVAGGIIGSGATACQSGTKISYVLVVWSGKSSSANITVTSSAGNGNLNVSVFNNLQGGQIDSLTNNQTIGYGSIPAQINCSAASGGACTMNYAYQWQSSLNNVMWADVPGVSGQNITVPSKLQQTTFFRRKVTETGTQTINYSNSATVFVNAPAAATQ